MDCFVFNDALSFSKASYLVKTLNNDSQKKIISSVFREGSLIKIRHVEYNGNLTEDELLDKVKKCHERTKFDITTLFKLSERLADSKQIGKRILLGRAFMKNNMFKEAINEFEKMIHSGANLAIIYFYLGKIHLSLSEYDKAISNFRKAIDLNQDYADYHFNLGKAFLAKQECKNAYHEFMKATNLNSYYGAAYYFLGLSLLRNAINKEEFTLAKDVQKKSAMCFAKTAQIDPNYKNEDFIKGEECLEKGNLEEAFERFSKVLDEEIEDDSQDFILEFYIKYLNEEQNLNIGEILAYISQLKTLVKKYAHYADLHYELGIAYVILSKFLNKKAISSFEEAISINPNYTQAQKKLKLIKNEQKGFNYLFNSLLEP